MGLLDDAIRQHLELKRRHGADPGDVAKLEHEVFGPVEREDALTVPDPDDGPPPSAGGDDVVVAHEEEVAYEESELEADERWAETHPEPEPSAVAPPEPGEAAPAPARTGGSVRLDAAHEIPAEADEPPAEPDPQPDPEPGEHDELEETPEFLQETPEHDRLWFEQKPPRDFDF